MSRTVWIASLICAVTGCAPRVSQAVSARELSSTAVFDRRDPATVQVRNYEGDVLPPYAINDAPSALEVECLDGQVYEIVDRPIDLYTPGNKVTLLARKQTPDDICDRILSTRTQRRSR
ncbi:MAG TPA: hypothetical protein VFP84_24575 [Kofleriaceae bacterium]|nr:hypothetical protein [Kofleriaceae bacterium]